MGHPRGPNKLVKKTDPIPWAKMVTAGHIRDGAARFEVYWLHQREKDPKSFEASLKPQEWLRQFGKFLESEYGRNLSTEEKDP